MDAQHLPARTWLLGKFYLLVFSHSNGWRALLLQGTADKNNLKLKEIKNGRLAMLAFAGWVDA